MLMLDMLSKSIFSMFLGLILSSWLQMKIWTDLSALQPYLLIHIFSWLSFRSLRIWQQAAVSVLVSDVHDVAGEFMDRVFEIGDSFQEVHVLFQGLPEGPEATGLQQVSRVQDLPDWPLFLFFLFFLYWLHCIMRHSSIGTKIHPSFCPERPSSLVLPSFCSHLPASGHNSWLGC